MNSKVKRELNSLENELSQYNKLSLVSVILQDIKNIKNIKSFVINLAKNRVQLKQQIFKYDRNLTELDKEILLGEKNKKTRENIIKILISLNKINEIIKKSLKNIILEIK